MSRHKTIIYHRHWPSLLKEAIAEGYDPLVFVWDNVEDPRASEVSYDEYAAAILNWCRTRSETVYQDVLLKCGETK